MSLRRFVQSCSPMHLVWFVLHLRPAVILQVARCTFRQRLPGLASEMAYYSMMGLFPGVLAVLTAIGLFRPLQDTFNRMASRLSEVAPVEVLDLIQDFAGDVSGSQNSGLFSISFAFALWSSSGAISAAMRALDQIHQIPPEQIRPFWKAKLVSLMLTVGTIGLLLVASGLIFLSDLMIRNVASQSGEEVGGWLLQTWRWLNWPLALGIVSAAFAFVYRFGPSRWTPGKPLVQGAVLAALIWASLSSLFRLYVSSYGNYNRVYGAVGAVIVLLLWLYLTSLVLLLGDQINVTVGQAMARAKRQQRRRQEQSAIATTSQSSPDA